MPITRNTTIQAEFIQAPKVMYKVEYNGLTHYVLGSVHNDFGIPDVRAKFQTISASMQKNLVSSRRIEKVFFEVNESMVCCEHMKSSLERAVYDVCQPSVENHLIEFDALENRTELGTQILIAQGNNRLYRIYTWSKDRFSKLTSILLTSLYIGKYVAIVATGFKLGLSLLSICLIWVVVDIVLNWNAYKGLLTQSSMVHDLARGIVYYANNNDSGISLLYSGFRSTYILFLFDARNEQFADKILSESKSSLFVYGIGHNISAGEEMPSVLDLLRNKGADITAYNTMKEFEDSLGEQPEPIRVRS